MAKEQGQITNKDDDIEIDLLGLLMAFRRRLWLILLAAVVCGSLAGAYSKFVLQEVIDRLGLDMSYRQLRSKISISDSSERIMTLTVTDPDPQLAKLIVNQVAATASDYIGDIMEMVPPKIIEDGEVNFVPVSPNNKRNTLLGAMLGAVLVCGVITVRFLMDDTVQTEEDVERYLGISVLAIVPERARTKDNKRKKKASRKARKKGARK